MTSTGKPYWAKMTKKSNLLDAFSLPHTLASYFTGIGADRLPADLWDFVELVSSFPFLVTQDNLKFEWG